MADRLAGGNLATLIVDLAAAGTPWDQMAKRLFADHGVEVTSETLRKWASILDADDESVVA